MENFARSSSAIALMAFCGISHADLSISTGSVGFSGLPAPSVTASSTSQTSVSANNHGALAATVGLPQFDADLGVLTGVSIHLVSERTQEIVGTAYKNNGPNRDASGYGASTAAIAAPGATFSFTTPITLAGGSCGLPHGPTGYVTCGWGPSKSAATATNNDVDADASAHDDYVGNGNVSASLTLPTLEATTTLSRTQGQTSGSTTTYSVAWSGTVEAVYDYLLHAAPSFDGTSTQTTLSLDFGNIAQGASVAPLGFTLFNLADANRTGLEFDSIAAVGDVGVLTTDFAAFGSLAQGASVGFQAFVDTSAVGLFQTRYTLNLSDEHVGAAASRRSYQLTLDLTAHVVPVPPAVWLFGSALAGLVTIRGHRKV